MFWYKNEYIVEAYKEMDKTVKLIKDKIQGVEHLLLIISDHGQKRGIHTPYGFWSCNKKLGLNVPKITDFADVVRSYLVSKRKEEQNP
jgi:hypothetical protein